MYLIHIGVVLLFLKICDAKSSLTFVIDTTSSMYDDIDETITASKKILRSIAETNSSGIDNFVLITFKDPDIFVTNITEDPNVFQSTLNTLPRHIGGGGDCPEYSMTAIETALRNSKRESFIYVFTDASAKDYMRVDIVNQLVQKLQSRIIFVLTGTCSSRDNVDYQVYQQVAAISSGQVFHCKKNEVGKVLETVPILTNGDSSVLTSKYLRRGNTYFTFNVDDRTDDVTVSISGENVKILRVADPDKKSLKSFTNLVNVDDTKIFRLKSPAPGTYTVLVYSDIRSTVVVNGKTLIDFQQGFSVFKPKSIKDTSRQPIKGQNTCLSVNIEDPDKTFELQKVQILTVHETIQKNISVIKNYDNFYVSEPFMPPNEMFKICIFGKDKVTGRAIKRLGKTFIEPQKPEVVPPTKKKPIVKIPEGRTIDVKYGSDVKISCQISAYPDPAVMWEDLSGNIVTNTATAVELPYDYVSYLKVDKIKKPGKYICKAKNSEGSNFETVHVKIKANLEIVEKPKDQSIEIGKDGMLLCKVTSYPPATIKWYINNKEIRTDNKFRISPDTSQLMLKNVDGYPIGTYKCEVDNGVEKKVLEAKVNVTGMVPPKLDKTVTTIHSKLKKEIILKCPVLQGKPEPTFSWHYKLKDSGKTISTGYVDKEIKVVAVVANDGARYTCSAKNYVGQDSADFVIIVDRRPEFPKGTMKKFQPEVGMKVTLPCSVDGEPKPNIKWTRNGSQLVNGNKYTIGPDNSLKFVAEKYDSSPNYECTATNKFGTEKYIAEVSVQRRPEFPPGTMKKFQPEVGMKVTLPCSVDGEPKPNIKWSRKGSQLVDEKKYTIGPDNSLKFVAEKYDSSPNYECTATNKFGTEKYIAEVSVQRRPEFPPGTMKKFQPEVGMKVTLPCSVDGEPKPNIKWTRNGSQLANGNKYTIGPDNSLKFVAEKYDSSPNYECTASNKFGTEKYIAEVSVQRRPEFPSGTMKKFQPEVGMKVTLPCSVDGEPKPNIKWTRNGSQLVDEKKYTIGPDNSLKFVAEKYDSSPNYECTASNKFGTEKYIAEVSVQRRPEFPSGTMKKFQPEVGMKVTLPCSVDGEPKPNIKWTRNGSQLVDEKKYTIGPDNSLKFVAEKYDSSPNYECTASNKFGTEKYIAEVSVQRRPEFPKGTMKKFQPEVGMKVTLPCSVDGEPKPNIKWTRNGSQLVNGNKYTIGPDNSLKFVAEKYDSSPNYECTATNKFGTEKYIAEVSVQRRPEFPSGTMKKFQPEVGMKVTLPCSVDGEPKPNIKWSRNGSQLVDEKKYTIGPDNSLKFVAEKYDSSPNYECTATNKFGTEKYIAEVSVQRRPEFPSGTMKKFQPEVGMKVTLPCSVDGEPKPNIKWSRNGSQLVDEKKYTIGPDNSLKFVAEKYDSSPNYECTATNKFGTEKYIAEVSVQTLPEISKEISTLTVPINNNLTLQCKILSGNPKPMVTWYSKGVPKKLLSVGDNLIQPIADINQAGIYYCEAKNSVGTDNHSINVIVEYPPRANKKESFVEVKQDAEAKLECEVYGLPKPKVQWIRNGYTITDSKYKLEDNVLRFPAQFQDNGAYYCMAYNTHGQLKYKVNLNVLAPAKIVNNPYDNPYEAVIGDYVLKVPCEVEGNPLPRIVWKHNGKVLESDKEYALDSNMTITIKNPKANVNFTCFAENIYGKDIRTFQVYVNEFVNIIEDSEHIYLLKGENRHIKCPKNNSNEDERWYKNGEKLLTGEFHIKNASVFDDGNYTCRVSNMEGSKSYPLYIDVGWPPKPTYEDKGPIEFDGSDQLLRCDVDVKPYPIIQWWKNGQILKNANFETLHLEHWGNYTCFVQGVHGNFFRNFKVFAQDCFIKPDTDVDDVLMKPLLLRLDSTWLDNVAYKYNKIQKESMVKLTCPDKKKSNYINQIKKSQIISQCKGGDQFDINGNIYKFSELKCSEELEPTMKETNETCLDKNSELIKVGFETLTEFVNVYDICIDKEKRIPLYTEMNLTSRQYTTKTMIKYKWTKDLSADVNYNYVYNCNTQGSKFRNVFRNLPKNCCMTKVQLVDPSNVYGAMQLTTFNYLNTVPIWNNCNETSNWFHLENKIRNRAYMYLNGLIVWSGTSGVLQMADEFNVSRNIYLDDDNKIPVPLYLWKVLSDIEIGVPVVAVIYVNVPNLKGDAIDEYTKCKDISKTIKWMADIRSQTDQGGYVYCCHLNEFTSAFNISVSIFKVNEKYEDYSDY